MRTTLARQLRRNDKNGSMPEAALKFWHEADHAVSEREAIRATWRKEHPRRERPTPKTKHRRSKARK